jgi:hypothetical protein
MYTLFHKCARQIVRTYRTAFRRQSKMLVDDEYFHAANKAQ